MVFKTLSHRRNSNEQKFPELTIKVIWGLFGLCWVFGSLRRSFEGSLQRALEEVFRDYLGALLLRRHGRSLLRRHGQMRNISITIQRKRHYGLNLRLLHRPTAAGCLKVPNKVS
jgi:hypothetical protein